MIRHVVICGGGTAGWMSAAALSRLIANARIRITLIESDAIGTVGVGEATIPHIRTFNAILGIDEAEFLRETQGTYKLGIEFVDWGAVGERYMHAFGPVGFNWQGVSFHQLWLKLRRQASDAWGDLEDYNLNAVASRLNRFTHPTGSAETLLSSLRYAFHFDAHLYAGFLRRYSEARGVQRIEGRITGVAQSTDGDISAVVLEDGTTISGDLFIDCTGFRALLIEGALKTGFEDWSHVLPNDRAIAVPSERTGALSPYTRATADRAGWRWRIPLQHRTGNGYVFASDHISEDDATTSLMAGLDGKALDTPRLVRFRTGRRKVFWNRNCVAIGLSAGFLEPLESTSIHLIQTGIAKLLALFPGKGFCAAEIQTYNTLTAREYEQARDFVVLHYRLTRRDDSDYWRHLRHMAIPDSLNNKIDLFRTRGRLFRTEDDLFTEDSWLAVMMGQGLFPAEDDPLAHSLPPQDIAAFVTRLRAVVARTAQTMPDHGDYLHRLLHGKAA